MPRTGPEFRCAKCFTSRASARRGARQRLHPRARQAAGADIPLDGDVELLRVNGLEPGAKPRELARGELFDGFLDIFDGGQVDHIGFARCAEKRGDASAGRVRQRFRWPDGATLSAHPAAFLWRAARNLNGSD